VVEKDRSDVVQMATQCEQTSSSLIRPDLDLVVVTTRYKSVPSQYAAQSHSALLCSQWLRLVEVNATDRPVVFFEAVDQGSHAVVPELDGGGVQRHENPGSKGGQRKEMASGARGGTSWGGRQYP
jgi:hypothetical protein